MTDLFAAIAPPVGKGNALVLVDIANGLSRQQIRENYRKGKYLDASPGFIAANLDFHRRA